MNVRIPWLGLIAACVLVIGLVLAFERRAQYYPGLVIVAGCLAALAFLFTNRK
jgi:hypothetical protein